MTQNIDTEKQRHSISLALRIGLLFLLIAVGLFLGLGGTAWAAAPQEPALASIDSHLGQIEIHFIDVGQGDAILVLADEAAVLIDGGDRGLGVVTYLNSLGVQHLDMVVATHPHADHIGGLINVLNAIPVDRVVTNGQAHTTITYEDFLDAIIAASAEYIEVGRGDRLEVGSITFDVLHPASLTSNLNDGSIVLSLSHGGVSSLFTGDIEGAAEAELLTTGLALSSKILKVAHHGSNSSSTNAFLAQVLPEHAIIQVGAGNRYGHPRAEVLMRLEQLGAEIWRTDLEGTIVLQIDGDVGTYRLDAKSGRTATSLPQAALFLPLILLGDAPPIPTPTLSPTATATMEPQPTATLTLTPTATLALTPTATLALTPTATLTPTPTATAEGSIVVEAWVSNATPARYSTVTVYGSISRDGVGISGVPMSAVWHYRTTSPSCDGQSNMNGVASCSRSIGGATAGYYVRIVVTFTHEGKSYVAETGFTPH